jgi:hypothetical protein
MGKKKVTLYEWVREDPRGRGPLLQTGNVPNKYAMECAVVKFHWGIVDDVTTYLQLVLDGPQTNYRQGSAMYKRMYNNGVILDEEQIRENFQHEIRGRQFVPMARQLYPYRDEISKRMWTDLYWVFRWVDPLVVKSLIPSLKLTREIFDKLEAYHSDNHQGSHPAFRNLLQAYTGIVIPKGKIVKFSKLIERGTHYVTPEFLARALSTKTFVKLADAVAEIESLIDQGNDFPGQVWLGLHPELIGETRADTYAELKAMHDRVEMLIAKKLAEYDSILSKQHTWPSEFKSVVEANGWYLPTSRGQLKERGREHHNCVGSYYSMFNMYPGTIVVFTDDAEAELRFSKDPGAWEHNNGAWSIIQCKGKYNENYLDTGLAEIVAYLNNHTLAEITSL